MSGTSLDGVDAVLACFDLPGQAIQVRGHVYQPFATTFRQDLLALNRPGPDELHRSCLAANRLSRSYAEAVNTLLQQCGLRSGQVRALGAHGQTVRHRPGEFDGTGYTIQLLNAALLSELSGVDVAYDFRNSDLVAGGQGAPLVPAFHASAFYRPGVEQVVLNVGGIANITLLKADGAVMGFDCGPGNVLMDLWCERHLGTAYDHDGEWASGGKVHRDLLQHMLSEPYIQRAPPKSTGRDLFNTEWLDHQLAKVAAGDKPPDPRDIQATLADFTCMAAQRAVQSTLPSAERMLVCGGGALNSYLMRRLATLLPSTQVSSSNSAGLPPLQVEAAAFAWLAKLRVTQKAGNYPLVTGAKGPRVLGSLHTSPTKASEHKA